MRSTCMLLRSGAPLLVALSLTWLAGCGRAQGASGPSSARIEELAKARAVLVGSEGQQAFWWQRITEQSCALVWFGPIVRHPEGGEWRHWVMTCSRPDAPQPWVWFQSGVRLDSRDPVGSSGEDFRLRLSPRGERTWREVGGPHDLEVVLEGFP